MFQGTTSRRMACGKLRVNRTLTAQTGSGVIAVDQASVVGEVVGEECAETFDVIAPVAVQFAGCSEPGHELRSSRGHPVPSGIAGGLVEGAGGIGDDKDLKAFFQCRECWKCNADLGDNAGYDQLLFSRRLYCMEKVFVIPGIDISRARNIGCVGEHFFQLRYQGAIGSILETGSENGWQMEVFSGIGQRQNIVLKIIGAEVVNKICEAGLVVDQQDGGVVFIEAVVLECFHVFNHILV